MTAEKSFPSFVPVGTRQNVMHLFQSILVFHCINLHSRLFVVSYRIWLMFTSPVLVGVSRSGLRNLKNILKSLGFLSQMVQDVVS